MSALPLLLMLMRVVNLNINLDLDPDPGSDCQENWIRPHKINSKFSSKLAFRVIRIRLVEIKHIRIRQFEKKNPDPDSTIREQKKLDPYPTIRKRRIRIRLFEKTGSGSDYSKNLDPDPTIRRNWIQI